MTKIIFIAHIAAILTFTVSQAKVLFPDSETAKNDVELGVEGIARLCPTGLWDHWTFRDIVYDRDSNTVVFVIQLNSWREPRDGKEITEADAQKQTEWIVENIMEGYNELKQSPPHHVRRRFHALSLIGYSSESDGERRCNLTYSPIET